MLRYKITNSNPYNINNIYTTKKLQTTLTPDDAIQYIIFLDSDDYWELNCIETCMKYANDVNIVWFDWKYCFDGVKPRDMKTMFDILHLKKQQQISAKEWMEACKNANLPSFPWVCWGIIDFNYLQKINLKFLDNLYAEDQHFGNLLFIQSQHIYIIMDKLYTYRIRPNSSSNFEGNQNIKNDNILPHLSHFYEVFKYNARIAKEYYKAASWILMLLELDKFIKQNNDDEINEFIKKQFIPHYIKNGIKILLFDKDPYNIRSKLLLLKNYAKYLKFHRRLIINHPNLSKPIIFIEQSIYNIKTLLRKIKRNH